MRGYAQHERVFALCASTPMIDIEPFFFSLCKDKPGNHLYETVRWIDSTGIAFSRPIKRSLDYTGLLQA